MAYSYQETHGEITPLSDDILVYQMEQGDKLTSGGIILLDDTNFKDRGIRPRWAKVYKVGKNITDVKPGQWVLIEHGRWTYGLNHVDENNEKIYLQKIDNKCIYGISDTYGGDKYIK